MSSPETPPTLPPANTTTEPPPSVPPTSDPPPPITTTAAPPPPVTTTTTTTTTDPPVTTSNDPVTTASKSPPETTTTTTTSSERVTTRQTSPPVTTTNSPFPPTETTPPYITQYITTVSVITITTLVPHTTIISGSVTTVFSIETTTSLQPTLIPDPHQPPPPLYPWANRSGLRMWQIGLVVACILLLLALCFAAIILGWFRRRRQELRDQEDKVLDGLEPWNDPATAAAVMGSPSGNGSRSIGGGAMYPAWHELNKEGGSIPGEINENYRHAQYPDTQYSPNRELMLVGYTEPYHNDDTPDYLGLGYVGHDHIYSGNIDYGLDYPDMGGADLASYNGSSVGDALSYSSSRGYPRPPQQHVSSNRPQEEPSSPIHRASYEDDYRAAVSQNQLQQQHSRVAHSQSPQLPMSTTAVFQRSSQEDPGVTSGIDVALPKEKDYKVEHRRHAPHALLTDTLVVDESRGDIAIIAPLLLPETKTNITFTGEGGNERDRIGDLPSNSDSQMSRLGSESSLGGHEHGSSTPGSETAAARSYLSRLRTEDST
ncbi:hypothetical protein FBU30_010161 [Linnemannia zychae]|nr:hypothetical protein FBU30_010161 [Linnemannia zychae]